MKPVIRGVIDSLKSMAPFWKKIQQDDEIFRRYMTDMKAVRPEWDFSCHAMSVLENHFSVSWCNAGSVVYELSHSMAAMFAMTSCPPIDWSTVPHEAFIVKVPRDFFPLDGTIDSSDSWILVAGGYALVVADHETTASLLVIYGEGKSPELLEARMAGDDGSERHARERLLCNRFLSNTLAFISTHRECVKPKGKWTTGLRGTFTVFPPSDVVIDSVFRNAAVAAVNAKTISGVRRALAHVVRGHWRNQVCGEKRAARKLIWVRPHRRGDESLGRVVERIARIR